MLGQTARKAKNVAIFLDTMNVINVKLCMMVPLIEVYLFIYHFQWPWLYFKVTGVSVTNDFNWKFDFLVKFRLLWIVSMSRKVTDIFLNLKNFHIAANHSTFPPIFSNFTVECGFSNLCCYFTQKASKQTYKKTRKYFNYLPWTCAKIKNSGMFMVHLV